MDVRSIYLDHAAATPVLPEVAEAMAEVSATAFANPSSQHSAGRKAKQLLEDAREKILELVGARTTGPARDRLIFTSGATEANRTALLGLATEGCHVALSARDHPSVTSAAAEFAARGHSVRTLPLDAHGTISRAALRDEIEEARSTCLFVAVTPVCGQTGIVDDFSVDAEIALAGELVETKLHADATQAAAWYPLDFAASPYTSVTLAPHKFGGPRGIGCLVVRGNTPIAPLLPGSQELGLRGGTEAVALAVGFAQALEISAGERERVASRVTLLRQKLEGGILRAAETAGLGASIIGGDSCRAPHIAAISIRGVDRQALVMAADLEGVCLSTGTACASGSSEPSPILLAMRLDQDVINGTFRVSLGRSTTEDDVQKAHTRLRCVFDRCVR